MVGRMRVGLVAVVAVAVLAGVPPASGQEAPGDPAGAGQVPVTTSTSPSPSTTGPPEPAASSPSTTVPLEAPVSTTAVTEVGPQPSIEAVPEASIRTVDVSARSLRVDKRQESTDEPQLFVVKFSLRPGVRNGFFASCLGHSRELGDVSRNGRSVSIRPDNGRSLFLNVPFVTATDLLVGVQPNLIGTLTVVMESDSTPNLITNYVCDETAATMKDVFRPVMQSLRFDDPIAVGVFETLAKIVTQVVRTRITPWIAAFTAFLAPWTAFDPDDRINVRQDVYLPVSDELLSLATRECADFCRPMTTSSVDGFEREFKGDDARYSVIYRANTIGEG